jgi:hypothetical protein
MTELELGSLAFKFKLPVAPGRLGARRGPAPEPPPAAAAGARPHWQWRPGPRAGLRASAGQGSTVPLGPGPQATVAEPLQQEASSVLSVMVWAEKSLRLRFS